MNISVDFGYRTFGGQGASEYSVSVATPDDTGDHIYPDMISVTFAYKSVPGFQPGDGRQSGGRLSLDRVTARWLGKALIEASKRTKFETKVNMVPG